MTMRVVLTYSFPLTTALFEDQHQAARIADYLDRHLDVAATWTMLAGRGQPISIGLLTRKYDLSLLVPVYGLKPVYFPYAATGISSALWSDEVDENASDYADRIPQDQLNRFSLEVLPVMSSMSEKDKAFIDGFAAVCGTTATWHMVRES